MQINKNKAGEVLTVALTGRLDTNTAPVLQEDLIGEITGLKAIELDLCDLEYISSAGLRSLLFIHKECSGQGAVLSISNCNDMIKDIFKMTGFERILNFK